MIVYARERPPASISECFWRGVLTRETTEPPGVRPHWFAPPSFSDREVGRRWVWVLAAAPSQDCGQPVALASSSLGLSAGARPQLHELLAGGVPHSCPRSGGRGPSSGQVPVACQEKVGVPAAWPRGLGPGVSSDSCRLLLPLEEAFWCWWWGLKSR